MTYRTLTRDDVTITVTALEEDRHWSDDDFADPSLHAAYQEQVDKYGLWGWCVVRVAVTWRGLPGVEGAVYLGGCSYSGEEEFRNEQPGYFNGMVEDALVDLNGNVRAAMRMYEDAKALLSLEASA